MEKKRFPHQLLFLILLIIVAFLYNYQEILFYPPYSLHLWRQSDCFSITVNYFKENLSFFTPKIHWTGENGNHKTVSEFPLIYYTVGQLWKLFGQKEYIFRGIDVLFVFGGLFSLFKLSKVYLKDRYWSIFVPLFLFSSPLLAYYTNNFTADAPALGMILTGTYFYHNYLKNKKSSSLFWAIIFASLAGLIKISSLLVFVAYLAYYFIDGLGQAFRKELKIKQFIIQLLPFFLVIIINAIWYFYARSYNEKNISGIFLQNIYPIWDLNAVERKAIRESLYWKLLPTFFNKRALALLLLLSISSIVLSFKKQIKMNMIFIISTIGVTLYIILWFKAFNVHDYYLTNLLIIIPFSVLLILRTLKLKYASIFNHWSTKTVAGIGLLLLIYQTTMINRIKYDPYDPWLKAECFMKEADINLWKYRYSDYNHSKKAFETITPYLRSLGITRDDLVISSPDGTINHTLCIMDQKGFTDFGYGPHNDSIDFNKRLDILQQQGAKYLIINDSKLLEKIDSIYTNHQIGSYQNVSIFELPQQKENLKR